MADGTTKVLGPSKNKIFFTDVKKNVEQTGLILVNKVAKNKTKYTVKEYSDAVHAHTIQDVIGNLSTKDYIAYVEDNIIPNCQIKKAEILCA